MGPEDFEHLAYTKAEGVAVITLNRPDRRNAWSVPMSVEYRWALHHAHHDPAVRVVVLTGAGQDFCVGADTGVLDAVSGAGGAYATEDAALPPYPDGTPPGFRHSYAAVMAVSTPVIAAIDGACAGAGFVLATYADLRWASATARIGTSFAGLGLPAEHGIGWVLPRIVGTARALELLYDPAPRSADEAQQLGFVQRVVPGDQLRSEVLAYAGRLARHSSADSLRMMKRAVLIDAAGEFDRAYRESVAEMDAALSGTDFRVGLTATMAKRRPDFLTAPRAGKSQVWDDQHKMLEQ